MIDNNKGTEFDVSALFGGSPVENKKEDKQPAPQPQKAVNEGPYPWGNEWLSVNNDLLFTEVL